MQTGSSITPKRILQKRGDSSNAIFDVVGKRSFSSCVRSLKEDGYLLLGNPGMSQRVRAFRCSGKTGKKVVEVDFSYKPEDPVFIRDLIESGKSESCD